MLNRILTKKIKSPLLLLGLFPFCHSRESGNPSPLSLRGAFPLVIARERSDRSNPNKGFSLIELMVAIVILALAIFGIFHAYSAGFMGMADARDRTVATNYAREAMEDIKNMDFDQITPDWPKFKDQPISGTKFGRVVIIQESTNLKKVITNVYWEDRNNNPKMVETSMVIHFIETTAGIPTRIMIIANPYNVLTIDDTNTTDVHENRSIITAVVKDTKGNTVTTYNNNITFTLNDSNNSSLIDSSGDFVGKTYSINAVEGIATVTFEASGTEGDVIIEASDSELAPDSVTIKVTDPGKPVIINLTADTSFMTSSLSSTSLITAEIFNAGNTLVEGATNEITFSVSAGPGTLSAPTTTPAVGGVATITLTSNGSPGTITVTATSSELVPDFVTIITGGKIDLFSSDSSVADKEKVVIGITTKDLYGFLINYIGNISLSVASYDGTTGLGDLSSELVEFSGDTYLETVDFTATSEGQVKISAIDERGILDPGELILTITPALIPDHIEVSANPTNIQAGSTEETSIITARIKTDDNKTITNYSELINFNTTIGTFDTYNGIITSTSSYIDENGDAVVVLYPSDNYGTAIITVSSGSLDNVMIEVDFYIEAYHIELVATPQNIQVGNIKFLLEATMKDENNFTVANYNESVTFGIFYGFPNIIKYQTSNTQSLTTTFSGGEVILNMKTVNEAGTATLKADSGSILGTLNIPVGIALDLVENSVDSIFDSETGTGTVNFNIDVQGAELELEEMQVSWETNSDETLNRIEIVPNSTGITEVIYPDSYPNISSGDIVDVENMTLLEGTSNVKLYFSADMSEKTFEVIFNPNSGNYPVEFTISELIP